jgi:hypothetical protein
MKEDGRPGVCHSGFEARLPCSSMEPCTACNSALLGSL